MLCGGCVVVQTMKVLKSVNEKEVVPVYMQSARQHVILVPVTHVGREEFYEALKDSIAYWKGNGYRIYYEEIDSRATVDMDSLTRDTLIRKVRYISGGLPTREEYSKIGMFKAMNAVVQPEWEDLGVTESDINADVSVFDIIDEFERIHHPVNLDSCNLVTPRDAEYQCFHTGYDTAPLFIDYRNRHVVSLIESEGNDKIVVIYGKRHIDGIVEILVE